MHRAQSKEQRAERHSLVLEKNQLSVVQKQHKIIIFVV